MADKIGVIARHYALLSGEPSHSLKPTAVSACSPALESHRTRHHEEAPSLPHAAALHDQRGALQEISSVGNGFVSASRCALFRVRRERNCLSVTDSYQVWSGDNMNLGDLAVE
jgi:hypothetical protein